MAYADEAPKTGTTIVGCVYNGGVVMGSDTRVSTGIYISNRCLTLAKRPPPTTLRRLPLCVYTCALPPPLPLSPREACICPSLSPQPA
jgi:hypothetical protein